MSLNYLSTHYETIDKIEHRHFWFKARNALISRAIDRFIPKPRQMKFLEIGCGTGIVLTALDAKGFTTYGIDINRRAIKYAGLQSRAKLTHSSLSRFRPKLKYDTVGAFDVLEHQTDDVKFIKQLSALTRPRGLVFLTVPAGKKFWNQIDELSGHRRRYEPADLLVKLESAGFKVIWWNYWQSLTLPLFLIWRRQMKKADKNDLIKKYLGIPNAAVNQLLYWILIVEQKLIFRIRFPAGASLIVYARKNKI